MSTSVRTAADTDGINSVVQDPKSKTRSCPASSKILIDLDNSPHVPFFLPIIEGLEKGPSGIPYGARFLSGV